MVASINNSSASRKRRLSPWLLLLLLPLGLALASWWFTEPLAEKPGSVRTAVTSPPPVAVSEEVKAAAATAGEAAGVPVKAKPVWPLTPLAGAPAKALLLEVLLEAANRLNGIDDYTAIFRKQERIKGKLGPVQTMEMKVRHKPFAVYFRFLNPYQGREVVYAEGHHDNKMIAHATGMSRLLVPRLAVPPDSPLALADSRHAVTEAGIANLTSRLINYRRLDLDDPLAETKLDRVEDNGKSWLRSVHTHPTRHQSRPFARVEVLYDPETFFPIDIRNYDWPEATHLGDLHLAEHYHFDSLNIDAELTALDFDPANPKYEFHRY